MNTTFEYLEKTGTPVIDAAQGDKLQQALDKLEATGSQNSMKFAKDCGRLFKRYFEMQKAGQSVYWDFSKLKEARSLTVPYDTLPRVDDENKIKELLKRVVVLKLNGGLGTSMGMSKAKSCITVRGDLTFLDVIMNQLETINKKYGTNVPLILMNSLYTQTDTVKQLEKYSTFKTPVITFQQSFFPRINSTTFMPLPKDANVNDGEWYPPGHGDVYMSLLRSGLLDHLIKDGRDYLFISNSDNLGATLDPRIVNHLVSHNLDWMSEVTPKTLADVKGGALVEREGMKGVHLLETANVPPQNMKDFTSVSQFKNFHCNNLWMKLSALKNVLEHDTLELDIIVNPKTGPKGEPVMQLETACGAAVSHFSNSAVLEVPRSRFLPVKKCSDLLLVQSDLYNLTNYEMIINPARNAMPPTRHMPSVNMDARYYKNFGDFTKRVPRTTSIYDLDCLIVCGDVTFGKNVVLKGNVSITAPEGSKLTIPDNAVLADCCVCGSLNIATM